MPLDRAVLEADLALIRGLLRQVVTRESHAGVGPLHLRTTRPTARPVRGA